MTLLKSKLWGFFGVSGHCNKIPVDAKRKSRNLPKGFMPTNTLLSLNCGICDTIREHKVKLRLMGMPVVLQVLDKKLFDGGAG